MTACKYLVDRMLVPMYRDRTAGYLIRVVRSGPECAPSPVQAPSPSQGEGDLLPPTSSRPALSPIGPVSYTRLFSCPSLLLFFPPLLFSSSSFLTYPAHHLLISQLLLALGFPFNCDTPTESSDSYCFCVSCIFL